MLNLLIGERYIAKENPHPLCIRKLRVFVVYNLISLLFNAIPVFGLANKCGGSNAAIL